MQDQRMRLSCTTALLLTTAPVAIAALPLPRSKRAQGWLDATQLVATCCGPWVRLLSRPTTD